MPSLLCGDIAQLTFKQTTGVAEYSEIRVQDYETKGLTNKHVMVDVHNPGDNIVKGCVVEARLGSMYFAHVDPQNVVVSGKALLHFVPVRGQWSPVGKRKLKDQGDEQISNFGVEFELTNEDTSAVRGPNGHDVDFGVMPIQQMTTGIVAATVMLLAV